MTSSRDNETMSSKRHQEKRPKDEKSTRSNREKKIVEKSAGKSSNAIKRDEVVKSSSGKVASLKKENGNSGKEGNCCVENNNLFYDMTFDYEAVDCVYLDTEECLRPI